MITHDDPVELDEYRSPTDEELSSSLFEAIWQAIKEWDISRRPAEHRLYAGATGSDVCKILDAINPHIDSAAVEAAESDLLKEALEALRKLERLATWLCEDPPPPFAMTNPEEALAEARAILARIPTETQS